MKLSKSDLFLLGGLEALEDKAVVDTLKAAVEHCGNPKAASSYLGWKFSEVERVLKTGARGGFSGSSILDLPLDEARGLTMFQLRKSVGCILVSRLRQQWSWRDIARFLRKEEWEVRRYFGSK